MAIYPCDRHGQRYRGAQQTVYPALLDGASTQREKRRLCPVCFTVLREWCNRYLNLYDDEVPTGDACLYCGKEPSVAVFVTLYPDKHDRVDYYGRCCTDCAEGPIGMALFGTQEAMARL